jgi:subtilisin family serine protease
LEKRSDVRYIEPTIVENAVTMDESRQIVNTQHFWNLGYQGSNIKVAILDTGIRITHQDLDDLDDNPGTTDPKVTKNQDFVVPPTDSANNPDDCYGHGTNVAGILSGTGKGNSLYKGFAPKTTLYNYKVYANCTATLITTAVTNAFNQAYLDGADVINTSFAGGDAAGTGSMATAADLAFDRGMAVVAAVGNSGPGSGTVGSPASAHKAISAGSVSQSGDVLWTSSSRGPTTDGRIKPEVTAPHQITATDIGGGYTTNDSLVGTSYAAPEVSGSIALLENKFRSSFNLEPGRAYVIMMNEANGAATSSGGLRMDNNIGAGRIDLSESWSSRGTGSTSVSNGQIVNIPFTVPTGKTKIVATIWWPEGIGSHNDIDLKVYKGTTSSSSVSTNPVTERVIVNNPASGSWTMEIKGFSVTGSQTVWYTYAIW